ncbi:LysE/ArgO family amino acid transporter [Salinarimonas sp. NSM]|uniref:LysE/ArgO family amino acid transporter n=1 Tax=Salinarimonas sp. NSM TaxID=3458003 RepID=UPI004036994A
MSAFLPGFLVGLGLILAIGAQNAFVLRQGLRRQHVWAVTLTCGASDAVLIAAGVAGFGALAEAAPWFAPVLTIAGAAFLAWYGVRSLMRAFGSDEALVPAEGAGQDSLGRTLTVCLALTWLNPHVYLDTLVLIGSVSTQYADRFAFAAGAITASFTFFLTLGHGARLLRPIFAKPSAWRRLELGIGVLMLFLALKLVVFA